MGKGKLVDNTKIADICLILEGTFPFIKGGVSDWIYNTIKAQSHLTFNIITIMPHGQNVKPLYEIPKNVISAKHLYLQDMPIGKKHLRKKEAKDIFTIIENSILNIHSPSHSFNSFFNLLGIVKKHKHKLGKYLLLDSKHSWDMLTRIYNASMHNSSFLSFFWSYRNLLGNLYSTLFFEIPQAKLYHSVCTGYAGLLLARAKIETKKPCITTEHGIYTNERKIEIASADWLKNDKSVNLNLKKDFNSRDLKDFWIDSFIGYARVSYEVSDKIITLYKDNQNLQISDGAKENKLSLIHNGIEIDKFSKIKSDNKPSKNLKIALIGRVVPIKDVKTYIRSCTLIKQKFPKLEAYIFGPTDEDRQYYQSCMELVKFGQLEDNVKFCGSVDLTKHLKKIDIVVLTSISEAQPLSLLEAGAASIPIVATNVGACKEIVYGADDEIPNLGKGGEICKISDPSSIASAVVRLCEDKTYYKNTSEVIKKRVSKFYDKKLLDQKYRDLYLELMENVKN